MISSIFIQEGLVEDCRQIGRASLQVNESYDTPDPALREDIQATDGRLPLADNSNKLEDNTFNIFLK